MAKRYELTSVVWHEEGGWVSKCPELGVASCGDDPEDALHNLVEAVELYLENAKLLGLLPDLKPVLEARDRLAGRLKVAVP
ncbi:MAG: type II toxin-antitoxin system HicB family antitoxin [Candidatus Riflebacteria bacterium]|nr:type II toxin-antitoxin system HicB family antitoxin [Candidatus Riflebacteria bacterium]